MKKKLILLITLIFLTGCSAEYNLEIKDETFKENIQIKDSNQETLQSFKDNKYYAIIDGVNNFKEYDKKIDDSKVTFKYTYTLDEFRKSTTLKTCFEAYNIIKEKNYYVLSTSDNLKCAFSDGEPHIKNLKIIIKNNHKVIKTNGKKINDYTYEWNYNENNFDSQSIYMKYSQDKYILNYNNNLIIIISIIIGILLLSLISIYVFMKKNKKANEL